GSELIGAWRCVIRSAEVLERATRADVNRRHVAEGETVHQAGSERARLHVAPKSAGSQEASAALRLRRRVPTISLDVPIRRNERTNSTTVSPRITEAGVQIPFAIVVRPRAEPSYQQRTGRLCRRRSAEE